MKILKLLMKTGSCLTRGVKHVAHRSHATLGNLACAPHERGKNVLKHHLISPYFTILGYLDPP